MPSASYFPRANRRGAEASSRSCRASCGRDLDVWKQVGPYVQTVLVQKIRKMDRSHMEPASGWPMRCQGKMTIATRKYRSNFTVSKNLCKHRRPRRQQGTGVVCERRSHVQFSRLPIAGKQRSDGVRPHVPRCRTRARVPPPGEGCVFAHPDHAGGGLLPLFTPDGTNSRFLG